jgi:tyrosine-protein kinase Etk/Wzc
MSNNLDNTNYSDTSSTDALWSFIYSKRKTLIVIVAIAMIVATVASFLITPMFRSTAIVFAEASANISFEESRNVKFGAADFGEEEQAEQLVQVLESSRLKDKMIKKFDLYKVYDIKEDDMHKKFKMDKAFYGHISFERTRYGSVQIDVLDANPKLAKEMADEILNLIDTVKTEILKERLQKTYEINLRKKALLVQQRDSVAKKIDSLTVMGVVTGLSRAQISRSLATSNGADRAYLLKQREVNDRYGIQYDLVNLEYSLIMEKMLLFEASLDQAESDANTTISHKFVVQKGDVADKKDSPKKLIIILLSAFSSLVFGVFALLLINKFKQISAKA